MRSLGLALCLLALPALAVGQSLGEVARKERERREKLEKEGKAARTLTEEDLASAKGGLANEPDPSAGETEEPQRTPRPSKARASRGRSAAPAAASQEEYWRGRVGQARNRVEQAERRYRSLDRMIRIGQPARYDENGKRVIHSQQRMKAMADEAEADLRDAEKALEDLLEEARKAGALPGWLRE
jgi:hypothetical protein